MIYRGYSVTGSVVAMSKLKNGDKFGEIMVLDHIGFQIYKKPPVLLKVTPNIHAKLYESFTCGIIDVKHQRKRFKYNEVCVVVSVEMLDNNGRVVEILKEIDSVSCLGKENVIL